MAILQYDTEGKSYLDKMLTLETRRVVIDSLHPSLTMAGLCERLGVGMRRTRSLIAAMDLRGRFRKWQKAEQ